MQTVAAKEPLVIHPSDNGSFGFGFGPLLRSGITITTADSIAVTGGDGALTVASLAKITATSTDKTGVTINANEGASATLSGATAGQNYIVTIVITDSSGNIWGGAFPVLCRSS